MAAQYIHTFSIRRLHKHVKMFPNPEENMDLLSFGPDFSHFDVLECGNNMTNVKRDLMSE